MDPMQSVEITGENVEAAINAGLEQLGVGPGDVLVEVVEEPSRGVFGIGAKPARVRLKLLRPPAAPPPAAAPAAEQHDAAPVQAPAEDGEDGESDDGRIGQEVLSELLDKLDIRATVDIQRMEATRSGEEAPWLLDVNGSDLSLLIGRRGETLAALQYITRLIASRRLQRRANIVVDVAGYKSKRSDRLEQLAVRMADQAVRQKKTVSLEPMPPNERRIIHLALRDRTDVTTKSAGEGDARKVTIIPNEDDE